MKALNLYDFLSLLYLTIIYYRVGRHKSCLSTPIDSAWLIEFTIPFCNDRLFAPILFIFFFVVLISIDLLTLCILSFYDSFDLLLLPCICEFASYNYFSYFVCWLWYDIKSSIFLLSSLLIWLSSILYPSSKYYSPLFNIWYACYWFFLLFAK